MRSSSSTAAFIAFLCALGTYAAAGPSPGAAQAPALACDSSLWKHVYNPKRLRKISPCITVSGTVVISLPDDDGDQHFLLMLDAGQGSLLTKRNQKKKEGALVVEVVCANPTKLRKPKLACAGYTNPIALPGVGDHVRVTGTHVIDSHNGWAEIHPVSKIVKL
ncbi:MAG: hypothetical protein LC721_12355 [Actinobacteria bacterium]|nr:hypothetical protein [Actinomycetota bacterium]